MSRAQVVGTFAVALVLLAAATHCSAAVINIVNNDPAGVGFNDPTAATPVGGNDGTTLGEQRLNAFGYAAALWGDRLTSMAGGGGELEINVLAEFAPIVTNPPCGPGGGALGRAGANSIHANFSGAPLSNTWYPAPLANALSGSDLCPTAGSCPGLDPEEIGAEFNSDVDNDTCLGTSHWYYGFDGTPSGGDFDLVAVVVHELGHGLGFASGVNPLTGALNSGLDDTYSVNLEDHDTGKTFAASDMNNSERASAVVSNGDLHWIGSNVVGFVGENTFLAGLLTGGFDPASDHMEMFSPTTVQVGSSVSHWNTNVTPNEIMEPFYTTPLHNLELTLELMRDIGWTDVIECGDADRSGSVTTTDALITLATATALSECRESLCDANGDGKVLATDAFLVLNEAVSLPVELSCGLAS